MSIDLTDDKSALVQVMAWCRQATSHYLSQCWPRSVLPYGITRPQWVNKPITSWIVSRKHKITFRFSSHSSILKHGRLWRFTFRDDVIKWKHFPRYWPFTWGIHRSPRSFDVSFDLRLNKRSSKQLWGWWFEMPSCSLWRRHNAADDLATSGARSSTGILHWHHSPNVMKFFNRL